MTDLTPDVEYFDMDDTPPAQPQPEKPVEVVTATDYSHFVESMIITEGDTRNLENLFGLFSEVGEAAGKIQKGIRDNNGQIDNEGFVKELSDIVFYVTALANTMGVGLPGLLEINVKKLLARKEAGTIQGSGDDR